MVDEGDEEDNTSIDDLGRAMSERAREVKGFMIEVDKAAGVGLDTETDRRRAALTPAEVATAADAAS